MGTSGVMFESEYEKNNKTFPFGYEHWKYNWVNPESLPFASSMARAPWEPFTTLQFGSAYEREVKERWELGYYSSASRCSAYHFYPDSCTYYLSRTGYFY